MTEWVLVPREPVDAQLTSMALTYDHGYGLRNAFERENIRLHMAQLHRAMLDAAPAAPQMTDAEMIRTEAWQSITDELAHAAYLRGIDEGKRQATAPQQAGQFDHLAGRGIHELRTGELPAYIVSLAVGHGPSSPVVKAALDWIVSELERKTNDERALAVKLDAIRTAPQQAEPVAWMKPTRDSCYLRSAETMLAIHEDCDGIVRTGWKPLYLHPPAAEVQRLKQERDGLKNRLEWRHDGGPDGISARDETIKMQDAEVRRLQEALEPFTAIDLTTNQAVDAMDVLRARRALEGK